VRGGHHNHHHNHGPNVPHEDHMHANESHEHHDQHRDHVRAGQDYHVHDRREETGQAPKSIFARPVSAIMAVGVRPCSGAIIVLVFALSQGLFALGVAAALFMALGTGLAVAVLATLAVTAKGIALRFASADANVAMRVVRGFEIGGAGAVLLLGLFLLGGALSTGLPS
jgi:nickel/cobalt exporter